MEVKYEYFSIVQCDRCQSIMLDFYYDPPKQRWSDSRTLIKDNYFKKTNLPYILKQHDFCFNCYDEIEPIIIKMQDISLVDNLLTHLILVIRYESGKANKNNGRFTGIISKYYNGSRK
jgi:hypothetical protein